MYVITIFSLDTGILSAHPYCPTTREEACGVARELARDFPNARITGHDLTNGRIAIRYAGVGVHNYITGGMLNA